jgi:hypothetical protein
LYFCNAALRLRRIEVFSPESTLLACFSAEVTGKLTRLAPQSADQLDI